MSEEDAPQPSAGLGLPEERAVFVSASQNARVMTEDWVERALFCPNCGAQAVRRPSCATTGGACVFDRIVACKTFLTPEGDRDAHRAETEPGSGRAGVRVVRGFRSERDGAILGYMLRPLLLLVAIAAFATPVQASPPSAADAAAMRKTLADSAVAWSKGDLDGFMASYEDSADTAFVTPKGVLRGWAPMRERYRQRYGEGQAMGALTFDEFQATALGADYAVLYGRFHLNQPGKPQEQTGMFDLIMHRTAMGWRIVSDHTS